MKVNTQMNNIKNEKEINKKIDLLIDFLAKKFNQIDSRFNQIDSRFNQIDSRFNRIEKDIKEIKNTIKEMKSTIGKQDRKISRLVEFLSAIPVLKFGNEEFYLEKSLETLQINNKTLLEIDYVYTNDSSLLLLDAKTRVRINTLYTFLRKIKNMKELRDKYYKDKKLYIGLIGMSIDSDVKKKAKEKNLLLLELSSNYTYKVLVKPQKSF